MIECPVSITPKAIEQVRYILANKNIPEGYSLRVGVRGGSCGTTSFFLGFDLEKEFDKSYQIDGVTLLIDKRQFLYILDLQLDFEEREAEQGFVFNKVAAPVKNN